MSQRAKTVSERIGSLNDKIIAYVESLPDDAWEKTCAWEAWPVGVTAYHLGASHFAISGMLGKVVDGEELPALTMDQVNAMSKEHAREHWSVTREEAVAALRENGAELTAFVAGLSDEQLDRKGSMPAFGGEVTTEQIIDAIIFESAAKHFDSMKSAVDG